MPIYAWKCPLCRKRSEGYRKISERDDAPRCCGGVLMDRVITPTFVKVFQPYRTIAWDREQGKPLHIRSSAEHRAFLRRNNYEEVGNDRSQAPLSEEEIAHNRAQDRADETEFTWTEPE